MSLTTDGLTIKRFTQIFDELNAGLKVRLGSSVDTSENALIGHLNANLGIRLAEAWELIQAVYDSGDLRVAEGASLDNLALNAGVTRQGAKQTQGQLYFTGLNGVVIPSGTRIGSAKGDEFITKETFSITSTRCLQTRLYIGSVVDDVDYQITMAGTGYTVDSGAGATEDSILTLLQTSLDAGGITTNTLVLDTDMTKSYLLVDKIDKTSELNIYGISYIKFDQVVTQQTIFSKDYGEISGDADAVTNVLTSINNWYSATNPVSLTLGSGIETDNDLRLRTVQEFNAAGNGTVDSITTGVLRLDGVKNCVVKENTSSVTVDSVPAKSYEVVVNGGINADIAKVVWDTKPAGIYLHGSVTENVVDFNGYTQVVRFSPAAPVWITLRVRYDVYAEETLPSGAIDAAKAAVLKLANDTLTMDSDIIAKRFLGVIYAAAPGFGDIDIDVAFNALPNVAPIEGDFGDVVTISDRQVGSFSEVRLDFATK